MMRQPRLGAAFGPAMAVLMMLSACTPERYDPEGYRLQVAPFPATGNANSGMQGAGGGPGHAGGERDYTVRRGDSVMQLVRRFGVPFSTFVKINHLNPPYNLIIGQRLRIPQAPTQDIAAQAPAPSLPIASPPVSSLPPSPVITALPPPSVTPPFPTPPSTTPPLASPPVAPRPAPPAPPIIESPAIESPAPESLAPESPVTGQPESMTPPSPLPPESPPPAPPPPEPAEQKPAEQKPAPVEPVTVPQAAPSPSAKASPTGTTATPPRSAKTFLWPVRGRVIATYGEQTLGLRNDGLNIAAPRGTPVRASENGVVVYAGDEIKGFGNLLLVRHADGFMTAYAHNDTLMAAKGDVVRRGQTIAHVGSSGNVTEPQLHFEIRRGSQAIDPASQLGAPDS